MTITKGVDNPGSAVTPQAGESAPAAQPAAGQKTSEAPAAERFEFIRQEIGKTKQHGEESRRRQDRKWSKYRKEGNSPFEEAMQSSHDGTEPVKGLPGRKPRYPKKSQEGWQSFFSSLLGLGKRENRMSRKVADLKAASFRGLMAGGKGEPGPVVVADLNYEGADRSGTDKFARISLEGEGAAAPFSGLEPGDSLEPQWIESQEGEIHYVKLETSFELGESHPQSAQLLLNHLRQQGSSGLASRMESSLKEERSRKEKIAQLETLDVDKGSALMKEAPLGEGSHHLFTFMMMGGVLVVLVGIFLLRSCA